MQPPLHITTHTRTDRKSHDNLHTHYDPQPPNDPQLHTHTGIVAILGTTYTGHFYDVEGLDALVEAKNIETGWGLGIHVDAASGGFVAPFAYPDLKWCGCGWLHGGRWG